MFYITNHAEPEEEESDYFFKVIANNGSVLCTSEDYTTKQGALNGIETLEKLRNIKNNKNTDTPIIMLTANALSGMREMYMEKGFTDYLSKPIDGIKLEKKIEKYLPQKKVITVQENTCEENTEEDSKRVLSCLQNYIPEIKLTEALMYCAGSEDFYVECLKEFCENRRKELIQQLFDLSIQLIV